MKLERVVADLLELVERRYYGKYRGLVVDNQDPKKLGRLRVRVPSVLGKDVVTGWATPCVPYGGAAGQGSLFVPDVDAGVWIEFEEGDLEFPIWVGTYWSRPGGESELPKPNGADGSPEGSVQDPPTRKIIATGKGHTLQFEDGGGEVTILLVDGVNGHVIAMGSEGVAITHGGGKPAVIVGSSGVQIGSGSAGEPLVLGKQFKQAVDIFIKSLMTHTHVGNLGAPTGPPQPSPSLDVPLSDNHKTEK